MTDQTPMSDSEFSSASQTKPFTFKVGFQPGEFIGVMALFAPIFYFILFAVEMTSLLWRPLTILLYAVLLFLTGFFLLGTRFRPAEPSKKAAEVEEITVAFTILSGIGYFVSFSQLARHFYLLTGGFVANQDTYWHWLRYGIANILESLLLDMPAIYEWHISEIRPSTFPARTYQFVFRAILEILVISELIKQIGYIRENLLSHSSIEEIHFSKRLLGRIPHLVGFGMWGIPTVIFATAIFNDGLSWQATWQGFPQGLLIVLLGWLAVEATGGVIAKNVRGRKWAFGLILLSLFLIWYLIPIEHTFLTGLAVLGGGCLSLSVLVLVYWFAQGVFKGLETQRTLVKENRQTLDDKVEIQNSQRSD